MNTNPTLLSPSDLAIADDHQILVAMYQYIVGYGSLILAFVLFVLVAKFFLWFLPKYWYRSQE